MKSVLAEDLGYHPPWSFPNFRDRLFKGGDRIDTSNRDFSLILVLIFALKIKKHLEKIQTE